MEDTSRLDEENAELEMLHFRLLLFLPFLLSCKIHLTTIQKILAEHEGFLRQFLVDDKVTGFRLLAGTWVQ